MTDLESLVPELSDSATSHLPAIDSFLQRAGSENPWVCFEADVRAAAATALDRLRGHGGERCAELLRLCEFEEQTRCQAFQATIMGEVVPAVYQETVRSILEKLLGKLETCAPEPSLYQAAAQCLSEYMSALNYHCDICAVPRASQAQMSLPAIAESRDESCMDSSEYPSELGSEDAETLSVHSVHSETAEGAARRLSVEPSAFFGGLTLGGGGAGARNDRSMSDPEHERKERRRESNKKASVKYRAKKTVSTQQVLQESAVLRQQMSALTTQNTVLAAENQLLKQQVAFLQGMLQMQGTAPGRSWLCCAHCSRPPQLWPPAVALVSAGGVRHLVWCMYWPGRRAATARRRTRSSSFDGHRRPFSAAQAAVCAARNESAVESHACACRRRWGDARGDDAPAAGRRSQDGEVELGRVRLRLRSLRVAHCGCTLAPVSENGQQDQGVVL